MDYQLMLPGFSKHFRERITTYLEKIGCWAVALYIIERGDNLYTLYLT